MRVRVSSLVAGVFVVALAVTGCAGSTGGQALGLGDEGTPAPTASGPSGAGSESPAGVVPTVEASAEAPVPATVSSEGSVNSVPEQPMLAAAAPAGYRIGDTGPGGGIVFYDAGSVQPWGRYLEAAPAGWSGSERDPVAFWCNRWAWVATSDAIGTGAANTQAMLAACPSGAATTASSYRGGGKADWFLPSKDELNALFGQRGSVGGFAVDYYRCSSQYDQENAWHQYFQVGKQRGSSKYTKLYVRPVRSF